MAKREPPLFQMPMSLRDNTATRFALKFARKGLAVNTFDSVMDTSGGTMKRTLKGWQLLLLGVGTMVGAGVFVSTGSAAQGKAGPAIAMSYLCAGAACILSALAYAEYACEVPMAGGAFNFITITFGEFAGWLCAANLFIEWTVANAAVAKGFSGYFCALTGIDPTLFTPYKYTLVEPVDYEGGFGVEVNWLAFLFVLVLTSLMLLGSQESTLVQNISVMIYLVLIAFIIFAGASQVDNRNYDPYAPWGAYGVMKGVTTIFFSYVGFDMVASMAEEAVNPSVDMPIGILGSISVATAIYIAMSTVLCGMVSYLDLDPNAPFATVFTDKGMDWAAKIVAVGAIFGCANSDYGGILGQSRIFVTIARAGLLPKPMAQMSRRQVPYWSIIASGLIAGILALLINLDSLWDFVSIGTLFAYGSVCLGCLWRRYVGENTEDTPVLTKYIVTAQLMGILAMGFWCGFGNQYLPESTTMWAVPLGLFFPIAGSFYLLPQRFKPSAGFPCPGMPWVPACGMMFNCYLIGTLSQISFEFWGIWMAICVFIYLVYGLHHTQGEGGPPISAPAKEDTSGKTTDHEMALASATAGIVLATQEEEGVPTSTGSSLFRPSQQNATHRALGKTSDRLLDQNLYRGSNDKGPPGPKA